MLHNIRLFSIRHSSVIREEYLISIGTQVVNSRRGSGAMTGRAVGRMGSFWDLQHFAIIFTSGKFRDCHLNFKFVKKKYIYVVGINMSKKIYIYLY